MKTTALRPRRGWRHVLILCCLCCGIWAEASGQTPGGDAALEITPSSIAATLEPAACHSETVALQVAAAPVPSLDVALVMDITGSMDEEIDEVRREATNLVQRIQRLVPDTRFAIATFADYEYVEHPGDLLDMLGNLVEFGESGDYPWRLDQPFTADAGRVQEGVNQITLLNGGDSPEPYLRALDESASLPWRPTARKIAVLFGDSYPHEIDPGADAVMDTADDLTEESVVNHLQAIGVSIFSLQAVGGADPAFYQAVAEQTGGKWYALENAEQAVSAIGDLVEQDVAQLRQVTLGPSAGYGDWVTWEPRVYAIVAGGEQVSFAVNICLPGDAAGGDHRFDLAVLASGAQIGVIPVTIQAPGQWWWLPWLLAPLLLGLVAFWWLRRPRRGPQRSGPARRSGPPPGGRSSGIGGDATQQGVTPGGHQVTHGRGRGKPPPQ